MLSRYITLCLLLCYISIYFAQTAALRRDGRRALSEKRKGHEGVDGDVFTVQVIHNVFPTVEHVFLNNGKACLGDEHRKNEPGY